MAVKRTLSTAVLFSLLVFALIAGADLLPAYAAECNGVVIDGQTFDATVYSYSTGRYYNVEVEFEGDEAIIHFSNGGQRRVTLDSEEIDDTSSISAYDYQTGTNWEIDISDCDGGGVAYAPVSPPPPMYVARLVSITVNGSPVGQGVLLTNGRVYVPIRLVGERLGAQVDWDQQKRQLTVRRGLKFFVASLGSAFITVNGRFVLLGYPAVLMYQQRAHVALRVVSEAIGAVLYWNPSRGTVAINSP